MPVITTFGYPGAGKGTFLDIAAKTHNYTTITMGDVVRAAAHDAYALNTQPPQTLSLDNDIVGEYATTMREIHGDDIMAQLTLDHLDAHTDYTPGDLLVIDGLRGPTELTAFKSHLNDTVEAVYIDTPAEMRLQHLQDRGRDASEHNLTKDELETRDTREGEWGLDALVKNTHYDHQISNNGTLDAYREQIISLLDSITP